MTINIDGRLYYRTAEACGTAGISKNTFLRWVRDGVFKDVVHRDRRGWRLFTQEEIDRLKAESNKTVRTFLQER
jgi:predicted site-specific integrase-resolvase